MGHNRLGTLPRTSTWRRLVDLLEDAESSTSGIASATAVASQVGLQRAKGDEGLSYAFWLLCEIPLAARQENFGQGLRAVGMDVPDAPSAFDVAGGAGAESSQGARSSTPPRPEDG